jgi:hypothetical protein
MAKVKRSNQTLIGLSRPQILVDPIHHHLVFSGHSGKLQFFDIFQDKYLFISHLTL